MNSWTSSTRLPNLTKQSETHKIFSVAVSILPLVSCVTDSDPVNSGVAVGDSLPHFAVTLNNGHTLATDSLKGKISVITFFNTSCRDCRKELPEIDKLRERLFHLSTK